MRVWVKAVKVAEREKRVGLVRQEVNQEKGEIMHNNLQGSTITFSFSVWVT